MYVYNIVYKEKGKEYKFFSKIELKKGDKVVLDTEKGLQIGKIVSENKNGNFNNLKEIVRKANKKDLNMYNNNIKEAKKSIIKAKEIANKLNLNMKFVDASFTLDRNQLLISFIADNRVDFRVLAKELAAIYKTRIELRQIGIRDKAREVSGLGQCGRKLCCSCFLSNLESVSISMVKNQNLALNPNKINGQCGRLLCCLNYEDEMYSECRKEMPNVGDIVNTEKGKATVIFVDILNRTYSAVTEKEEKVSVTLEECGNCGKSNK